MSQEEATAAGIDKSNASNLMTQGYFGVGKSLLSSAGDVGGAYSNWSAASPATSYYGGIR